jgi:hypothetical protein
MLRRRARLIPSTFKRARYPFLDRISEPRALSASKRRARSRAVPDSQSIMSCYMRFRAGNVLTPGHFVAYALGALGFLSTGTGACDARRFHPSLPALLADRPPSGEVAARNQMDGYLVIARNWRARPVFGPDPDNSCDRLAFQKGSAVADLTLQGPIASAALHPSTNRPRSAQC